MTEVHQQLIHLIQLAQQLAARCEKLETENTSLQKQLRDSERELAGSSQKIQLLEGDLKSARIARGVASGSEDTELAKAKINTLMREIDRCIALLNE